MNGVEGRKNGKTGAMDAAQSSLQVSGDRTNQVAACSLLIPEEQRGRISIPA